MNVSWNVNIDRVKFLKLAVHIFQLFSDVQNFLCCLLWIVCYVPLKREWLNYKIELSAHLIPIAIWSEVEGVFFKGATEHALLEKYCVI